MVAVRIRPKNEAELQEQAATIAHKVSEQMVTLMDPTGDSDDFLRANRSREKTFIFDVVFDKKATQEEVYESTTKNLVEGVISGYNATVFAYGPTGTGKTYTMLGIDCEPGIYIMTLNDLFKAIEETSENMDYSVSMSYLEIYNEIIRDLLNPTSGVLELREDSKGAVQIAGITEFSTSNANEIMQLLRRGNKQRTQEPTAANKTSSRSHAVLQVIVKQKSKVKAIHEEVRVGRLFMIDLAGSERAAQTQNRGQRMKEGAHINRSLLALGNCINALSEKGGNRSHHVNFRDSKLTRLLKDSLGGNSRTVMITHISPASTSFEESRSTLIYAYRAKNIKTRVKRNLQNVSYHIAQYTSIIADLRKEIERLEDKVKQQEREKLSSRDVQGEGQQNSCSNEANSLRDQLINAFKEQMEMRRSIMKLENTNAELHIDSSRHLLTIADWEQDKAQRATKPNRKKKNDKGDEDSLTDPGTEEDEDADTPVPHEVVVAREEINMLLAEQKKTATRKSELEKCLSNAKLKASQLEQLLPKQISNEDQREVLRLLCKVHELEISNTELQAKALCKENLLSQKDFVIDRHQQHRRLCEEIIRQQRVVIEDKKVHIPDSLEKLYQVYSQEQEKGTLKRLQQRKSRISSILKKDLPLNGNPTIKCGESLVHLDMDQLEKAVLESRTNFHLPSIILESDSDSKTSKSTPGLAQTRQCSSLSPTSLYNRRNSTDQKHDDQPSKGVVSSFLSPNTLDTERRHSISVSHLRQELLEEIAIGTQKISQVAARRRSRVLDAESPCFLGQENGLSSLNLLEKDAREPKDLQSFSAHRPLIKKSISIESFPEKSRKKTELKKELMPPKSKKDLMNERLMDRKRSSSFEASAVENPRVKPENNDNGNVDILSNPKRTPMKYNSKTFLRSNATKKTKNSPAETVIKLPSNQETDHTDDHLQILEVTRTPPSTIRQSNAGQNRAQILHKRIKDPKQNLMGQAPGDSPGNPKNPPNSNVQNPMKPKNWRR
ncbi:kinesin-like protein KIF19 [Discoglossus pictus]